MSILKILTLLFIKRKPLMAVVNEIKDVIAVIRSIRDEGSSEGKNITKKELLTVLDEIEEVLLKIRELIG